MIICIPSYAHHFAYINPCFHRFLSKIHKKRIQNIFYIYFFKQKKQKKEAKNLVPICKYPTFALSQ
jgi:hypothetical protein